MPNRCVNTFDSDFVLFFCGGDNGDSSAVLNLVLLMYDRSRFQLMDCLLCSLRSVQICAAKIKLKSCNRSTMGNTIMPNRYMNRLDSDFCVVFVAVTALQSRFLCCWCMTVAVFSWWTASFVIKISLNLCRKIKLRFFNQSAGGSTLICRIDVWIRLILILCCFYGGDSPAVLNIVLLIYDRSRFLLMDCLFCNSRSDQICATNIKLKSFI